MGDTHSDKCLFLESRIPTNDSYTNRSSLLLEIKLCFAAVGSNFLCGARLTAMKFIHNLKFLELLQSQSQNQKEAAFGLGLVSMKRSRNESASNIRITVKLPFFTEDGNIAVTFHINLNYSWVLYYVDAEF